jgi:hypothetical protein
MSTHYRHTQSGVLLRLAILPGALGVVVAGLVAGPLALAILVPLAVVLTAIGWCFSSLTVEVTPSELTWFFGPGIWRNTTPRDEIVSATPETNTWWWGWGIHLTPRGWLYNVAGFEAVEVTLRDGKRFRIGSDETRMLAEALRPATNARRR